MGTSLIGLLPQNTYSGLIKVGNNTALNTTLKTLSDGAGNDLPMQASTTAINFTGTVSGVASGVSGAIQFSDGSAFASDAANLFWDDTNDRLGIKTNSPTANIHNTGTTLLTQAFGLTSSLTVFNGRSANDSTVSFGNGSGDNLYFGGSGLFVTGNTTLGNGTTSLSARLGIKGSGSTSATTSLLVQNSSGTQNMKVTDDGQIIAGNASSGMKYRSGTGLDLGQIGSSGAGGGWVIQMWDNDLTQKFGYFSTIGCYLGSNLTGNINSSAHLQVDSTTKGFLPPRMTTTQKNAIATPAAGLEMYDSTAKSPAYYDGTNWGYTGGALQNAAGNSGTLNISFAAGNIVNLTLNATTTLAFSNAVIGTYIIQVTQGATGSNSLAYPASVKWAGGTAPTLSTAVGKTDILTFYYDGTFYYGNYSLNY